MTGEQPLPPDEAEALAELEERLQAERPLPSPGFRSMLRSQLLDQGKPGQMSPGRLRALITAYASGGLALLLLAAAGVLGTGPLST